MEFRREDIFPAIEQYPCDLGGAVGTGEIGIDC